MFGARRRTAVALAILVGLAVTAVLVRVGKVETWVTVTASEAAPRATSSTGIPERVARQVAELKAESLEQSLANLGHWELWSQPGGMFINESGRLPLKDEDGAGTVKMVLSNRRFLKVYEEFSALPTAQATELLNRYLPLWFEQYSEKYAKYIDKGRRVAPASAYKGQPGEVGIAGGGGGSDGDGLPNLECMRWRLLGLVLIAGNLRLQGTAPWVQQITEQARAQRDYLYQAAEELSVPFRAVTITTKSLYNRQILGYALLRTSPVPEQALTALAATERDITVKTSPVYDALRTPYDRILMGLADYSKGSFAVEHLAALSDGDFEIIFAAAVGR